MKSTFNKLEQYITEIDNRNKNTQITNLIGVTIAKDFIPSVANVIGTNLSNYKIISKNQFACSLMQVSRDGGIAVALYKKDIPAIMSPAYHLFEVKSDKLLPEYLDMILKSKEFDRAAVFYAVGGVRGTLTWEEFCGMRIPVPSIQEQEKIVHDYKVVVDRVELLKKIKNKLYSLSEITYKKIKSEQTISLSKISELKEVSSGITKFNGTKKYIATGDINYDEIWSQCEFIDYKSRPSRANMQPIDNSIWFAKMQNTNKYLYFSKLSDEESKIILSTGFMGLKCDTYLIDYLYAFILTQDFIEQKDKYATGTTQIAINSSALDNIKIAIPRENCKIEFDLLKNIFSNIKNINNEIEQLLKLKENLLSILTKEV